MSRAFFYILVLLIFFPSCKPKAESGEKKIKTNVEVWHVVPSRMEESITLPGTLEPVNSIIVSAEVGGKVDKVYVAEGDEVRQGQILLDMENDDYILLYDQACAQFESAEISLDLAGRHEASRRALWESGDMPDETYNDTKTALESAENRLKLARAARGLAKRNLDKTKIYSPITGVVTGKFFEKGELVGPGKKIFEVVTADRVKLVVWAPERVIEKVREDNRTVTVQFDTTGETLKADISYMSMTADKMSRTFKTEIEFDNPRMNPGDPASPRKYRLGYIAKASLTLNVIPDAVKVPIECLVLRGMRQMVFVVEEAPKEDPEKVLKEAPDKASEKTPKNEVGSIAVARTVEVGLMNTDYVQIRKGLGRGDVLIISGQRYVDDGDAVKVIRPKLKGH